MQCPQCKVNMKAMKMGPVAMDECPQCAGIWFDQGELDQFVESSDPDLRWMEIDFWQNSSDFKTTPGTLVCPKCNKYYLTRLEDRATDTAVAVCNTCQGLWFGPDQLRAILEAITQGVNQMDSAGYLKESLRLAVDMIQTASEESLSMSQWRDFQALLRMLKYRIYSEHPKLVNMLVGAQKSLPI